MSAISNRTILDYLAGNIQTFNEGIKSAKNDVIEVFKDKAPCGLDHLIELSTQSGILIGRYWK